VWHSAHSDRTPPPTNDRRRRGPPASRPGRGTACTSPPRDPHRLAVGPVRVPGLPNGRLGPGWQSAQRTPRWGQVEPGVSSDHIRLVRRDFRNPSRSWHFPQALPARRSGRTRPARPSVAPRNSDATRGRQPVPRPDFAPVGLSAGGSSRRPGPWAARSPELARQQRASRRRGPRGAGRTQPVRHGEPAADGPADRHRRGRDRRGPCSRSRS